MPAASSVAAAMRGPPKRSLNSQLPRIAPTMTLDSRSAATGASGARVYAHSTRP
jgi:hypothetical protein